MITSEISWPPLTDRQYHESYEGKTRLLPHVPIIGYQRYLEAIPNGLIPEVHEHEYEFHYVLRGYLDWRVNDRTYQVRPGMIFVTRPGELHGSCDTSFQPTELYWFQLQVPQGRPMKGLSGAETQVLRRELESMSVRLFPASAQIQPCFERILDEHRYPSKGNRIIARTTLYQLVLFLLRDAEAFANGVTHPQLPSPPILRAMALMEANLADPPLIESLALEIGMSPSHFRARFRQETGSTPHEHLTRQRIEKAKQLLLQNRWSVTEVAFRLGYSSSQNFASAFKRQTGMAPNSFRRANQMAAEA